MYQAMAPPGRFTLRSAAKSLYHKSKQKSKNDEREDGDKNRDEREKRKSDAPVSDIIKEKKGKGDKDSKRG